MSQTPDHLHVFSICPCSNPAPCPTSVLEASCQSRGRGIPGRQHHHSTPLVNRPQKINPAFQPQQQQPLGFGQVSTCRDKNKKCATQMGKHVHKDMQTKTTSYVLLMFFAKQFFPREARRKDC